jgi:hypothetical protein
VRITRSLLILIVASPLIALFGCKKPEPIATAPPPDYGHQLGPGEIALRPARPDEIPDFGPAFDQRAGLEQAAQYSLEYLSRNSSQKAFQYGP